MNLSFGLDAPPCPIICISYYLLLCFQYHGGTNFGRTAGGPFIATSYDYDAPLDEYGKNSRTSVSSCSRIELHVTSLSYLLVGLN